VKRRRQQRVEERRKAGIEVNLLAEREGGLVITTVELVRAGLG
jgi:hypothetical protein